MKVQEILANAQAINVSSKRGGKMIQSISLVNCDNGKRFTISKSLFEALGEPESIQLAVNIEGGFLIIAVEIAGVNNQYRVINRGRGIVYNSSVVKYIADVFNLDFSEHVSMSFDNVKVKDVNGIMTAFVKMC